MLVLRLLAVRWHGPVAVAGLGCWGGGSHQPRIPASATMLLPPFRSHASHRVWPPRWRQHPSPSPPPCPALCCPPPPAQGLAAEVVSLEERLFQAKSADLRERSQASGASEVVGALRAQLEAVSKERGGLLGELAGLREAQAALRAEFGREVARAAAAEARAAAAEAALAEAREQQRQRRGQRHREEEEQQGPAAGGDAAAAPAPGEAPVPGATATRAEASDPGHTGAAGGMPPPAGRHASPAEEAPPAGPAVEPAHGSLPAPLGLEDAPGPAVSASIALQAMQQQQQGRGEPGPPTGSAARALAAGAGMPGLPPELASLLPSRLYTLPLAGQGGTDVSSAGAGPWGAAPELASSDGVLRLVGGIHQLLEAVEADKQQLLAALQRQVEEGAELSTANARLQRQMEAAQARLELAVQQQQAVAGGSWASRPLQQQQQQQQTAGMPKHANGLLPGPVGARLM